MDMDSIMSLIGSLGFPIAMCLIMFNYMDKERETHAQEVEKLTETLNNNTNVLSELKLLITQLLVRSGVQKGENK